MMDDPMIVVIDASALLAVILDEPERAFLLGATLGVHLVAPAALPFEIANALVGMHRRHRLSIAEAQDAWQLFTRVQVELLETDLRATLDLALERGTYAYDALYLLLAKSTALPLVTLDRRMQRLAEELGVDVRAPS